MFKLHSYDGSAKVAGIEYLPCSAITPKIGMALVQSSGKLAIATGTTAPTYISMCEKDSACTAGDIIPVIRVNHDMIFETTFSADPASVNLGDKVTLHASSGLEVTATTTSGVAEVVYKDADASGAMCRVRF
jgi:hypothetical protein